MSSFLGYMGSYLTLRSVILQIPLLRALNLGPCLPLSPNTLLRPPTGTWSRTLLEFTLELFMSEIGFSVIGGFHIPNLITRVIDRVLFSLTF